MTKTELEEKLTEAYHTNQRLHRRLQKLESLEYRLDKKLELVSRITNELSSLIGKAYSISIKADYILRYSQGDYGERKPWYRRILNQ